MENKENKITKQQQNNNMLLDIIIKLARLNAITTQLLDFNCSVEYSNMILDKTDYENIDLAITTIADMLYKKHKQLIQTYLNKQEKKGDIN
nr:MAG: hypothetical protein [Microvirus Sku110]